MNPTSRTAPSTDPDVWPGQWIALERETIPDESAQLSDVPWIWHPFNNRHEPHRGVREQRAFFRREFSIARGARPRQAELFITADHGYRLFVDDVLVHTDDNWRTVGRFDLTRNLTEGRHVIAVEVNVRQHQHENLRGPTGLQSPAGLLARLILTGGDGTSTTFDTDASWRAAFVAKQGWFRRDFDDSDWQPAQLSCIRGFAAWTGADDYCNRWYCYRRTFDLDRMGGAAIARIAVDSKYWLWINGRLVVFEGGVKRGPNPRDTYHDTVDLSPHLRAGRNTIAVLAWYWGRSGFSHQDSGHHGFYFDLRGEGTQLVSDRSWRAMRHPAFGESGPPHPNYRLSEFNVHYDARRDPGDWTAPDYDDSAWNAAVELGSPPTAPWHRLHDRLIPLWADSGLVAYPAPPALPWISDGRPLSLALPCNAHVTPWFEIEAVDGQTVDVRTDHYAGGSEQNLRSEYVARSGRQTFETPAWINGHNVEYRFAPGIKVLDLKYRETAFAAPVRGNFQCDDPALNELWRRSLRTLLVCMRDTYYDCPDRERAQWWGDAVIEVGQTFYALDRVADTLNRKAMRELVGWQRADGTLYSPVPAGKWNAELPDQMLMSIGEFGFWEYYRHTGDRETIETVYPHLRPYLELWDLDDDGLVVQRRGDWYWNDWGTNKDDRVLDNCYYAIALRGVRAMAQLLGRADDEAFCASRLQSIQENFNRVYWTGSEYRSPEYKGETDDRAHALAVLACLVPPERYEAIATVLARQFHASPYLEKYVLEALFRLGRAQEALDRLVARYQPHLNLPLTTLLEGWGVGAAGYGGGTANHSWSGGPLTLLSQYVAGVEPITPGYERFRIRPAPGRLKRVSATVPSVRGEISMNLRVEADEVRLDVVVPPGCFAEIELPSPPHRTFTSIEVDGQILPAASAAAMAVPGGSHLVVGSLGT